MDNEWKGRAKFSVFFFRVYLAMHQVKQLQKTMLLQSRPCTPAALAIQFFGDKEEREACNKAPKQSPITPLFSGSHALQFEQAGKKRPDVLDNEAVL